MKLKREHAFLLIFIAIIIITGCVLIRYITLTKMKPSDIATFLIVRPAYLQQPIPKIDKLKTVLDNPKFREMVYVKDFFTPLTAVEKGRPNPFVPFVREEEGEK